MPGIKKAVEPIRTRQGINKVKKVLKDKPLDYCFFILGINTNLRASDLLQIRIDQVKDLEPMDEIVLKEKKTKKVRRINLNKSCIDAIQRVLKWEKYKGRKFLFEGQRGLWRIESVSLKVKTWCKQAGLKGNYASHSLRKSWGYWQHKEFGTPLPELMVCFNHSSQRQTLDYLCIQSEEIRSVYANEIG